MTNLRKRDLKTQTRIRCLLQLHHHVAERFQHIRQTLGSKTFCLVNDLRTHFIRNRKRRLSARHRKEIHIAHALRQIRRQTREIATRLRKRVNPHKCRRNIALGQRVNGSRQIARRLRTAQLLHNSNRHRTFTKCDSLLKSSQGIAQAAIGSAGDDLKRLALEFNTFRLANLRQTIGHPLVVNATKIETLATRQNSLGDFLRIRGAQDKHHMTRGFFQSFQQRVKRRHRKHVNFVNDVHLVFAARGGKLHATDNFLAHVFYARATRGVKFVDVGMLALGDFLAACASSIGVRRRAVIAQQSLRQKSRRSSFTRSSWAAKKIRMTQFVLVNGVLYGAFNMILTHDL